jgi:hypothetical protein
MQVRLMKLVLTAAIVFGAGAAGASPNYQYVFDKPNYTASPGATVDVLVYLQETGASVLKDDGLIGSGVTVRFDDSPRPGHPAKVLSTTDVANVSAFELLWSKDAQPSAGYADLSLGTFGAVYGTETPAGSGAYLLPLGRFTFTAGAAPGEVTYIRATDFSPSTDDTVYYRGGNPSDPVALDSLIHDGTATILTVPEPSVLMLLGSTGLAYLLFYGLVQIVRGGQRLR